jgi:hypothetical protein
MTASRCQRRIGRNERRALAAGCEVHTIAESPHAFVFACLGQPPRIYIPEDLPAPYRDYAVLAMFERLTARGADEAELRAIWAELVRRIVAPDSPPVPLTDPADGLAAD